MRAGVAGVLASERHTLLGPISHGSPDGRGSPRGFYLRYGFTDTGRVMWGENALALNLATRG